MALTVGKDYVLLAVLPCNRPAVLILHQSAEFILTIGSVGAILYSQSQSYQIGLLWIFHELMVLVFLPCGELAIFKGSAVGMVALLGDG